MDYKNNLLDGLAEVVAKQVEGNALPLLKPIDETQPQLEVEGTAVAKLDVDARAVVEEMMDAQARMDRDAVYQQIEWYKQELKKEKERTLVYKELYEKGVEEIEQKNEEIAEKDKVIEQKDEEIDELKKKNIRLEAQLEYAKNNPQTTNIIQGDQINNNTSEVHSETKIEEIKVESGGTGVNGVPMQTESSCQEVEKKDKEDIEYCKYIQYDKVALDNDWGLGYGETAEEKHKLAQKRYEAYNRHLMKLIQKADYKNLALACATGEKKGILNFKGENKTTVGKYFQGLCTEKVFKVDSFTRACYEINWQPKPIVC